jgi:competence protein ComEC
VLTQWRGLRIAFVSNRISSATQPAPVDVLVLRRNARLKPETVAAVVGPRVQVVFDSSCKIWYVGRQDSTLRAHGFRTWDVTAQGAFRCAPPDPQKTNVLATARQPAALAAPSYAQRPE